MNNALLSQIDMQPLDPLTFKGANDEGVQGFMVKPLGFDPNKKYPLKFLIHGGPQGAWGNEWTYRWNAELFAASGNYVVVMINFHGSTGYGQKFTDSISGDWGGTPYIDLMKGLDYRRERSQGFELFTSSQVLKVPSKMLYFPDEGHWVLKPQNSQLWYTTVNDWVDQWCK